MKPPKPIPSQSDNLVQALKKRGAPQRAARALVIGADPALAEAVTRLLKPKSLVVRDGDDAFDLAGETSPLELVVAGAGLERASLAGLRARLSAIAGILKPDGRAGLWVSTLSAPDDDTLDHQALLFPFAAATGALGPSCAATTPLSASSWTLLARACGFEIVSCEGFGMQPLPHGVADHAGRLAVYDDRELASGRLLMLLQKDGAAR